MKIMFFGSGLFPLPIFQRLAKWSQISNLSLVTVPNHSFKEKNLIKNFAVESKLQIYQPYLKSEAEQFKQQIQEKPDIGIVCNYGYMIPSTIIDIFNKGVYVIHPSLLPKYRGAAPIQRAILNNETMTGVSYIEISKNKFDAGAILLQLYQPILPEDRYKELSYNLSRACANSIEDFIMSIDKLPRITQDESQTTKAPKLTQEDAKVDFNKTAQQIYNQYRAIYGTIFHSLKFKYLDKEIYVENLAIINEQEKNLLSKYNGAQNGSICLINQKQYKNLVYVKCNENTWLKLVDFRFADRGGSQPAYTFKNQFMMDFKYDSTDNNYKFK